MSSPGIDRPWPTREQSKPSRREPKWSRELKKIMQEARPPVQRMEEARAYERRYGEVEPFASVEEYDRERMTCTEEDDSPDTLARYWARWARTPNCVLRGQCETGRHEDTCPEADT